MELKEYLELSEKTYVDLEDIHKNNTYLLLNLSSIYLTYFIPTIIKDSKNTDKLIKIGGDMMFLLANYARLNNIRFAFYGTEPLDDLGSLLGQLVNIHNQNINRDEEVNWEVCERNLQSILSHLQAFYNSLGVNLRDVINAHAEGLKTNSED